jgi:uncharacterized membrane-anchored protein YjiN (DUF445 family)
MATASAPPESASAASTAPPAPGIGPKAAARLAAIAAADQGRRIALRRMKALATGLLLLAALIYMITLGQEGVLGFVNTAAEAAMVGALADWFAVTALFRHPLGLPIPHTALIRTRKDQLGESLEEFVASNFLSEEIVRERIGQAQVTQRLGAWLSDPQHAQRVSQEVAAAGRGLLTVLNDDDVASLLEQVVLTRVSALPLSPAAGKLIDGILDDGAHHRLLDILLDEALGWLEANQEAVMTLVTDQAPSWSPQWLDNRVARRIYNEIVRWVHEVRIDENHEARRALDDLLRRFADDLQHDERTQARMEALKQRLLNHPEMRRATVAVWSTVRRLLIEAIEDEDGELRARISAALLDLGRHLATDPNIQQRLDAYVAELAGYVVRNYAGEVATVISETVKRWDAAEASRRIELLAGRDLQFIRINGTVVGALAGVAIHTASVLLT